MELLEHTYLLLGAVTWLLCLQGCLGAANKISFQLLLSLIGLFLHELSLLSVRKIVFF